MVVAKIKTDLITTTSRTQTQWGRPPPRRVSNTTQKTQKNTALTARVARLLFHTGKRAK